MFRKLLLFVLILFLTSCGSTFIEYPPDPPDFEYCDLIVETLTTTTQQTPIKLPIENRFETKMWTDAPEHWDEFDGSIHLASLTWNLDWVSKAWLIIGDLTIASYDEGHWTTSPRLDLSDVIVSHENGRLSFEAKIRVKGWKPAGEETIQATAEVWLCGENSDLVAANYKQLIK